MNDTKKPYPRLLAGEPDLTLDQVWGFIALSGQGESRFVHDGVVIADTADQAVRAVVRKGWTPWLVLSETMLDDHLAAAETGPTHVVRNFIGWAGTHRFACVFASLDEQVPFRLVWVLASSEAWARSAWPQLGETHAPKAVLAIETLVELRNEVRQVRLDRGDGALTDGRPFEHLAERVIELARERVGESVWKDAQREFAEKLADLEVKKHNKVPLEIP